MVWGIHGLSKKSRIAVSFSWKRNYIDVTCIARLLGQSWSWKEKVCGLGAKVRDLTSRVQRALRLSTYMYIHLVHIVLNVCMHLLMLFILFIYVLIHFRIC